MALLRMPAIGRLAMAVQQAPIRLRRCTLGLGTPFSFGQPHIRTLFTKPSGFQQRLFHTATRRCQRGAGGPFKPAAAANAAGRRLFHTATRRCQRVGPGPLKPAAAETPPFLVRTALVGTIVGVCTPIFPVIGTIRAIL